MIIIVLRIDFSKYLKKSCYWGSLKKKVLETRTPLHKSISELDPYFINSFKNRPGMFEILQQISFKKKKKVNYKITNLSRSFGLPVQCVVYF